VKISITAASWPTAPADYIPVPVWRSLLCALARSGPTGPPPPGTVGWCRTARPATDGIDTVDKVPGPYRRAEVLFPCGPGGEPVDTAPPGPPEPGALLEDSGVRMWIDRDGRLHGQRR
jgi:hypothetical protein